MLSKGFAPPWIWLLTPLCYFVAAKVSVAVAVMPEGVALLWLWRLKRTAPALA